jgi:ComF family protein
MLDKFFILLAPHDCLGCGAKGNILCASCKHDTIENYEGRCLKCNAPIYDHCGNCQLPYTKQWCVSEREGAVERVINAYKFESARAAAPVLADILAQVLPELPKNTVVVPVPTTPAHIRQRGFDHIKLVAQRVAKLKKCSFQAVVTRKNNTVQFGANAKTRAKQAKQAFTCSGGLNPKANYLIIDDISTTGATLTEVAKVLKQAGAKNVWVAVLAHQPLKH